jgi:hypothetical protein
MDTLHNLHPLGLKVGEVGVTLRRGMTWADKWINVISETDELHIALCECSPDRKKHKIVGKGVVTDATIDHFCHMPASILAYEDSAGARTYDGSLRAMRSVYGEDFDESELVTVLTYRRTE